MRIPFSKSTLLLGLTFFIVAADCVSTTKESSSPSEECKREEGKFLCKSGECLHNSSLVCDKNPDCLDHSDEFPGCEQTCLNTTCRQGCLPDPNQNATGSGSCFCLDGYTLSKRNKRKCEDKDECLKFGTCSQKCNNLVGSYQCSCITGFRLTKNSSCKLLGIPTLIHAQHSSVRVTKLGPIQRPYYSIVEKIGSPVSVSYDSRNSWVYWSDIMDKEEAIWRSKMDGTEKEKFITTGLILPQGVAYDWIGGNLYFTDSKKRHIVVCTGNGRNCTVLIEELGKLRDLALHPNLGVLYWTDWGLSPAIMRAGMDGSIPLAIIHENLKWPNGIAIDHGNGRIYWTDAGVDLIETANLEGEDRRVVHSTGIKYPFGIDVFGDHVYWSDWNTYQIQRSNKFTGSDHETLVREKYEQLNGVAVFHKANQPIIRKNHCKDSDCSHICTLTPNNSFRCMCPTGMYLDRRNKRTCVVQLGWPNFVVGYNNTLKISPVDSIGGNTFQDYVIPKIKTIVAIATIPLNTTVFLSDVETKKIYSYDLKSRKLATVVDSVGFAKGLDYDEIGHNLYWVDSMRKTIEVMSLKTRTRVVLFKEIDRPVDIVVAPNIRMIFLAQMSEKGGKIVKMNMNGFNRRVLSKSKPGSEPVSLTYNIEMKRLYWTDAISETVESIGVDGTGGYVAVNLAGYPFGITSIRSSIYWTDRHTQSLMGKHLKNFVDERGIFLGDYDAMKKGDLAIYHSNNMMAKVTIMNKDPGYNEQLLNEHECSPRKNQCSHICLLAAKDMEGTCICPDHLKLDEDGYNCTTLTDKDTSIPVVCAGGRCRTELTTTKKPSKSKSKSSSSSNKNDTTTTNGKSDNSTLSSTTTSSTSSSTTEFPQYSVADDFVWWDNDDDKKKKKDQKKEKGKSSKDKKKLSDLERESRREGLDYDDYDGSLPSDAKIVKGKIIYNGQQVIQQESDEEKDVITEGAHPFAIALGIIILLVLVAVIIALVLHRRNVHPKVLVRPYVQQWVKYVNQPVQRFFENRGEQLDGKKHSIYDEVYHSPTVPGNTTEYSYSRGYENIDDDSSVNVYEEPGDSHRITYSQTDKLLN